MSSPSIVLLDASQSGHLFFLFLAFTFLDRTSRTMMNKNNKSGHPLLGDLGENIQSFIVKYGVKCFS